MQTCSWEAEVLNFLWASIGYSTPLGFHKAKTYNSLNQFSKYFFKFFSEFFLFFQTQKRGAKIFFPRHSPIDLTDLYFDDWGMSRKGFYTDVIYPPPPPTLQLTQMLPNIPVGQDLKWPIYTPRKTNSAKAEFCIISMVVVGVVIIRENIEDRVKHLFNGIQCRNHLGNYCLSPRLLSNLIIFKINFQWISSLRDLKRMDSSKYF